jgi:hypothetical protein
MRIKNDIEYCKYLSENYFYICENKKVLEFASLSGDHTDLILKKSAKKIICVEPNLNMKTMEVYTNDKVKLYSLTLNDYYKKFEKKHEVDVVTCMGLLYHLHSPFHALEQILNYSRPQYIITETFINDNGTDIAYEEFNIDGNAFCDNNIKFPIKRSLVLGLDHIYDSICDTGYKLVKRTEHINQFIHVSKNNIGLALFERLETIKE